MTTRTNNEQRIGWRAACAVLAAWIVLSSGTARAWEPVNPGLTPEARRVVEYLHSVEGRGIVAGMQRTGGGQGPFPAVLHKTGREPALYGQDIAGFHPKGSDTYHQVLKGVVAQCVYWWQDKGGIVQLLFHWGNPMHPNGTAWKGRPEGSQAPDIGRMVTPGTEEYEAFHKSLSYTANYLQQLADARVPVLFSPLHEIDGGWFWWTDVEKPENTAALYRQVHDYLVKQRGLNNVIWVYHAAHSCNRMQGQRGWQAGRASPEQFEEEIAFRRRYYPGDQYVDVVSLSAYGNPQLGWNRGWEDARQSAYRLMRGIAPNKPLAINEEREPLHPLIARQEGVNWLWARAWYSSGPTDWLRYTFNHEHTITLDELPLLHDGNVMPNVRIDWPTDGLELQRGEIQLSGMATDRNGNLESVTVHALSEPWMDWVERWDDAVKAAFERSVRLGEARLGAGGRWTFTWSDPPAGEHQLVAFARDAGGAVATSNVVRITAAVEDLARGKPVTASSTSPHGGPPEAAVDGDPHSSWWADQREDDPQWLQVDLGAVRNIGAVSVLWWKAYAADYTVQVSDDAADWREVARVQGRRQHLGDSDLHRFDPVEARYVRLHFTKRAVNWQAYCVYRLAVYGPESVQSNAVTSNPR
jgi:mannan endo-1,4-beta-mannosidase